MPLWQAEFGWSRSAISSIAAAALLVMAAVAPFAGYIADRRGPRALLGAGRIANGIGLTFVVFATPDVLPWLLPLGFAGVAAVGFGRIAPHVGRAATAHRVDEKRSLRTGIGPPGSTGGER